MNLTDSLLTKTGRVKYLVETVPDAALNSMLLTILYWEVFEGIRIPKEVKHEILAKGSDPEVLGRLGRLAAKHLKEVQENGLLEEKNADDNDGTIQNNGHGSA